MTVLVLIEDNHERPVPQYVNQAGNDTELLKGANGHLNVRSSDGQFVTIGSLGDNPVVDHTSTGTLISVLKSILRDSRVSFNDQIQVAESAQRAATSTSTEFENLGHRGAHVILNVTNLHDTTPSVTLKIQAKDEVGGVWYNILTGAAVSTVSTNVYKIFPGSGDTNDQLPFKWRVRVEHADTDPITYSVGANLLK